MKDLPRTVDRAGDNVFRFGLLTILFNVVGLPPAAVGGILLVSGFVLWSASTVLARRKSP